MLETQMCVYGLPFLGRLLSESNTKVDDLLLIAKPLCFVTPGAHVPLCSLGSPHPPPELCCAVALSTGMAW